MKNKKAQIGITLTWFTTTLVVFLIMLIFIAAAGFLSAKKVVSGNKNEIVFSEEEKLTPFFSSYTESDFLFNKFVILDGKEVELKNAFILLMVPYAEEKNLKLLRIENINDVYLKNFVTIDMLGIDKKREGEILNAIQLALRDDCVDYFISFPLGDIYKISEKEEYVFGRYADPELFILGDPFEIIIPYKNHNIKLILRSRYVC